MRAFVVAEVMFFVLFGLAVCVIGYTLICQIRQWNKNNHSPRLTVPARVVSKQRELHRHHYGRAEPYYDAYLYSVTFQVESGDRMELSVSRQQYGMLAEGDYGRLSFQGTRYLGFERTV